VTSSRFGRRDRVSEAADALAAAAWSTPVSQPADAEPPPGLDIAVRVVDGTVAVAVAGEVDMDTASALQTAVITAIDDTDGRRCILDLTGVTFLNPAGLTALIAATEHAEARQETLRIVVDANRPVIRPITITGLDQDLRLYHTIDEAVKAGNQRHPSPHGTPPLRNS
jgi:anti-sigma B factor antagonist